MIKALFAFLLIFFVMYFCIPSYRKLSGKEKWSLVKLLSFSTLCAVLSISFLTILIVLF